MRYFSCKLPFSVSDLCFIMIFLKTVVHVSRPGDRENDLYIYSKKDQLRFVLRDGIFGLSQKYSHRLCVLRLLLHLYLRSSNELLILTVLYLLGFYEVNI